MLRNSAMPGSLQGVLSLPPLVKKFGAWCRLRVAATAMQMDPAVRTIAISGATAIIGYISSSLLNMRAA